MIDMKDYFDQVEKRAVQNAMYEFRMQDCYHVLLDEYRYNHNDSFKFLAEMPVEDGIQWVKTTMLCWIDLHRADPIAYPSVGTVDAANAVRAYRKSRKKAAKQTKAGKKIEL